jgi:transposase
MNCPKCKSSEYNRDGVVRFLQRYKCKQCNYRYAVEKKSDHKSDEIKRLVLEMYLEGLGFRSISRILKISYVTAFKWIKERGRKSKFARINRTIEIVELDEMNTYIISKKYGLLLADLEKGMSILCVEKGQQKYSQNFGTKFKI